MPKLVPKWGNTKDAKDLRERLWKVPTDWGSGFDLHMAKMNSLLALRREKYNRSKRDAKA